MAEPHGLNEQISANVRRMIDVLQRQQPDRKLTMARIAAEMVKFMPLPAGTPAKGPARAEAEERLRNRVRVALGDCLTQPPRRCWRADLIEAFTKFAGASASALVSAEGNENARNETLIQLAEHLGDEMADRLIRLAMAGRERSMWVPMTTLAELLMKAKTVPAALEICHTVIAMYPEFWAPTPNSAVLRVKPKDPKRRSRSRK